MIVLKKDVSDVTQVWMEQEQNRVIVKASTGSQVRNLLTITDRGIYFHVSCNNLAIETDGEGRVKIANE